jgi:hypothetical protein
MYGFVEQCMPVGRVLVLWSVRCIKILILIRSHVLLKKSCNHAFYIKIEKNYTEPLLQPTGS